MLPTTIGEAIREKRAQTGLSARQLSLAAELSPSYIGKVEKGEIEPSLRAFASIATVLNMSAAEIVFVLGLAAHETE